MKQSTISLKRMIIFGLLTVAFIPLVFLGISSYLANLSIIQQFQNEQKIDYAKSSLNLTNKFLQSQEYQLTQVANAVQSLTKTKIASYLNKQTMKKSNKNYFIISNEKNVFSKGNLSSNQIEALKENFATTKQLLQNQEIVIQKVPWRTSEESLFLMSKKVNMLDHSEVIIQLIFSTRSLTKDINVLNSQLIYKKSVYLFSGESLLENHRPQKRELGIINQIATYNQNQGNLNGNKTDQFASIYYQKSQAYPFFVMAYTNKTLINQIIHQKLSQLFLMMALSIILTLILAWFIAKVFEDGLNKMKDAFLEASHGHFEVVSTQEKRLNLWELFHRQLHINEQIYEIREVSSAYHYMLAEFACFHSDITKQINILNQRFDHSKELYLQVDEAIDALLYQAFQNRTILSQQENLVQKQLANTQNTIEDSLALSKESFTEINQNHTELVTSLETLQTIKDAYAHEITIIYESFVRMYISLNEFNDHQLKK